MKKTILIITVMILLAMPLVSAECTWWNPLTWGECIADFFKEEKIAVDVCEDQLVEWTTINHVYINKTYTFECDPLNISCDIEKHDYTIKEFSHRETIYHNKTICKLTGKINISGEIIRYKDLFCLANQGDYLAVCYHNYDGRGKHGKGNLLSGETGVQIKEDKIIFKNSLKINLIEK